ncbi:MAG: hypothetical protein HC866_12845 [Leptolyngbyaceae cyanobacterium RU_5_1]|nr:hypothetical protein [Leptolyngbyaceae cyanobacterium RU_5_1]
MQRLLHTGLIVLLLSAQTALSPQASAQAAETQPQQTQEQQTQEQQTQSAQPSTSQPKVEAARPQPIQPNPVTKTETGELAERDRIVLERYLQRVIPSQE